MSFAPQIKQEQQTEDGTTFVSNINGSALKRKRTEDFDEIQMTCPTKLSNYNFPEQRTFIQGIRSFLLCECFFFSYACMVTGLQATRFYTYVIHPTFIRQKTGSLKAAQCICLY